MDDDKLNIRVSIADRLYPVTIDRDEEELIRKAAKRINDMVLQYKKVGFSDKDDQDYLAMSALQFMSSLEKLERQNDTAPIFEELTKINDELDSYLAKE